MKSIKERVEDDKRILGINRETEYKSLVSDLREAVEGKRLGKYDVHPQIKEFTNVGNYNQALDDILTLLDTLKNNITQLNCS
jgi:hypothetical protein